MREQEREEQLADIAVDASERRISIWSVPVDFGPWFYLLLVTHTAPLVFLLWWTERSRSTHDNIANIIVNVTSGAAPLIFVAAVATIIELEVLMVLREWYRAKQAKDRIKEREKAEARLKEEYEKGIEKGIDLGRQLEREEQAAGRNGKDEN